MRGSPHGSSPCFLEPCCSTALNWFTRFLTHSWNIPVALFMFLEDASHPEPVFFFTTLSLPSFCLYLPSVDHDKATTTLAILVSLYSLPIPPPLFFTHGILLWCTEWIIIQFRHHLILSLHYTIINCAHLFSMTVYVYILFITAALYQMRNYQSRQGKLLPYKSLLLICNSFSF